jgi:hypothetical protein
MPLIFVGGEEWETPPEDEMPRKNVLIARIACEALIVFIILALAFGCGPRGRYNIPYSPNPNVNEPAKVIERVIKQQPASYTYVPFNVVVNDDCIEMKTSEPGGWFKAPGDSTNTICFRNVGKITLNSQGIWYADILDKGGAWIYYVWSYDESELKFFIDAMYVMMDRLPKAQ